MDNADMAQERAEKEEAERLKRLRIDVGISPMMCCSCGKLIPEKRRLALPGTVHCVTCAEERENR